MNNAASRLLVNPSELGYNANRFIGRLAVAGFVIFGAEND